MSDLREAAELAKRYAETWDYLKPNGFDEGHDGKTVEAVEQLADTYLAETDPTLVA